MFCYHCGQKLPDKANFCFTCGTATMIDTSGETARQAQEVSTRAVAVHTYTGEVLPAQPNSEGTKPAGQLMPYVSQLAVTPAEALDVPLDRKIRLLLNDAEENCRTHALREALHLCSQALKRDKNNSEIYLILGKIFEESQRYTEALMVYEQAITLGSMPTSGFNVKAEALERKVLILCSFRRYSEALTTLDASIKLYPQRDSLYSLKINVLMILNRPYEQVARTQREQQQLAQLLQVK